MKRTILPLLYVSIFLIMLLSGCENSGAPVSVIPSQFIGSYSGTWTTTFEIVGDDDSDPFVNEDDDIEITDPTDGQKGTWSYTVDEFSTFTSGNAETVDNTFSEPVAMGALDPITEGQVVVSYYETAGTGGAVVTLEGMISHDGSTISGTISYYFGGKD